MKRENIVKLIFFLTIMLLIGVIGVFLAPYLSELENVEDAEQLLIVIRELGVLGIFVFASIQMLQVIIFVIPGEIIEVLAGMLYGTFWGFIICMCGISVGTTVIFSLAKKLGFSSTQALFNKFDNRITGFLEKDNNLELLFFILFFFPGSPKDMFTYFAPFTSISLKRFLPITLVARIPSVLSSTFIGAQLLEGNVIIAAILYAVTGIVALAIYLYRRRHPSGKIL